jgi:peptidoglycan hydrolase-like protein with peptidoglycan-binding domain
MTPRAALGLALAALAGCGSPHAAARAGGPPPTGLATVTRRASLSETTPVAGTLGYAGAYTVRAGLSGTLTALPEPGRVIREGQVLYRVDDAPVVLLRGAVPAYRTLALGAVGRDVRQLNRDLTALGYAEESSDRFGWATAAGVEKLQAHLGAVQTGVLALGRFVFAPTAARISTVPAALGAPASGVVLTATSTTRRVAVALDAGLQAQVRRGDRVTITLPDGRATPGRVAAVGTVATAGADGATVPVRIAPIRPADVRRLDQAPVEVAITDRTVHGALAVPVSALVALAGGRYAVELARPRRLVRVALGLFDDVRGLTQVTGRGLAAGQRVVVPAS